MTTAVADAPIEATREDTTPPLPDTPARVPGVHSASSPNSWPASVQEAILRVKADVPAVPKSQRNEQQNFNYRGIDAVVNAVSPAMTRHGLILTPNVLSVDITPAGTTRNGALQRHILVKVEFTLSLPGGHSIVGTVYGEAIDSSDKGVSKAITVAERTFLIIVFTLPTDEPDPDSEYPEGSPLPDAAEVSSAVMEATSLATHNLRVDACNALLGKYGQALYVIDLPAPIVPGYPQVTNAAETIRALLSIRLSEEQAAQQARAEQDQAAEGPARQVVEKPAGPQAGPLPQAVPPQQTPPQQTPNAGRQEETLRALKAEAIAQARVLGVPVEGHTAPFCSRVGAPNITVLTVKSLSNFGSWVVDQRPGVVAALRERGNSRAAAELRGLGRSPASQQLLELMLGEEKAI